MNIVVLDSQGILSESATGHAEDRLRFSLSRFFHRIHGATMHLSLDDDCAQVRCTVNVHVEGIGIVSVSRISESSEEVVGRAVDAIEPRIAFRVDWNGWFNAETLATWRVSANKSLHSLFGLNQSFS
ncbi:MAG: HPF/RaiA family ribosome-associated protein [Planctomycetota bacterium]